MKQLTFSNFENLLHDGQRIVYGQRVGIVRADQSYRGGFCVDGRSILNILDEFDLVEVIGDFQNFECEDY